MLPDEQVGFTPKGAKRVAKAARKEERFDRLRYNGSGPSPFPLVPRQRVGWPVRVTGVESGGDPDLQPGVVLEFSGYVDGAAVWADGEDCWVTWLPSGAAFTVGTEGEAFPVDEHEGKTVFAMGSSAPNTIHTQNTDSTGSGESFELYFDVGSGVQIAQAGSSPPITHDTVSLRSASTSQMGAVNTLDQAFNGAKTFKEVYVCPPTYVVADDSMHLQVLPTKGIFDIVSTHTYPGSPPTPVIAESKVLLFTDYNFGVPEFGHYPLVVKHSLRLSGGDVTTTTTDSYAHQLVTHDEGSFAGSAYATRQVGVPDPAGNPDTTDALYIGVYGGIGAGGQAGIRFHGYSSPALRLDDMTLEPHAEGTPVVPFLNGFNLWSEGSDPTTGWGFRPIYFRHHLIGRGYSASEPATFGVRRGSEIGGTLFLGIDYDFVVSTTLTLRFRGGLLVDHVTTPSSPPTPPPPPISPPPPPGTSIFRGHAAFVGGSAVAGRVVTLSGASSGTATTSSVGAYTFGGVVTGTNYVTLTSPGGETCTYEVDGVPASGVGFVAPVTTAAGEEHSVNFWVSTSPPPPPSTGNLQVTVTNPVGTAVVGRTVTWTGTPGGSGATDSMGQVTFTGLTPQTGISVSIGGTWAGGWGCSNPSSSGTGITASPVTIASGATTSVSFTPAGIAPGGGIGSTEEIEDGEV